MNLPRFFAHELLFGRILSIKKRAKPKNVCNIGVYCRRQYRGKSGVIVIYAKKYW